MFLRCGDNSFFKEIRWQHEGQKQIERRMQLAQEFNVYSKYSWVINYKNARFITTFLHEAV